jgi:polyisoprenoid-binding protein YceI
MDRRRFWTGLAFTSPLIFGLLAFTILPVIASLWFSLFDYPIFDPPRYIGFSNYTAQFRTFTADMTLDPAQPETAKLTATVELNSLAIPAPPAGFIDELLSDTWLGASITPQMKFESTSITRTGPATADIVGNLTLKGATKPVTLHATFNGGYEGHPMDPAARIGFSAHGTLKRSDFDIDIGIPAPGSTMGVFDEVTIDIETEFTGPALETQ